MPRELTYYDLFRLTQPGQTVFVANATGEPTAFVSAWRRARALAGVQLISAPIPMLNRLLPDELGDDCRLRTAFLARELRGALAKGLVELLPFHYSEFYDWIASSAQIDLAVFQASPPDVNGRCNLGPATDLLPAILSRPGVRLVAQINGRVPPCQDGVCVAFDELDAFYRAETALPELDPTDSDKDTAIAEHAAQLVKDGATLQIGIGRLPDQVLARLKNRKGLKLHGGTVTAGGLALLEAGAADSIVAGTALGNTDFYQRIAAAPRVAFRPVAHTHASGLTRLEQFVAINSAVEVDLFGQANCEVAGGRLLASVGGINDFLRAARRSPGGRAAIMLPAVHANGARSRIVPRIGDPGLVSVQRADVDTVITDYGVADLHGLDLDGRAAALIRVAAPDFRQGLAASWAEIRAALV
jgi:4-hydroxybutyrate CoA-transferase